METIPKKLEIAGVSESSSAFSERKRHVIENFRSERAGIIKDIFRSKTFDLVGNILPGSDVIKMSTEAAVGQTSGGEKLSASERFWYAAISSSLAAAYILYLSKMPGESKATRMAAGVLAIGTLGPKFIEKTAVEFKDKYPKVANLLLNILQFTKDKKKIFKEAGDKIEKTVGELEIYG